MKIRVAIAIVLGLSAVVLFCAGFNQWLGLMAENGFREPTARETVTATVTTLCVPFGVISFEILTGRLRKELRGK